MEPYFVYTLAKAIAYRKFHGISLGFLRNWVHAGLREYFEDHIAFLWSIEDVKELALEGKNCWLTDDQAREILHGAYAEYNSEYGFTEVNLDYATDDFIKGLSNQEQIELLWRGMKEIRFRMGVPDERGREVLRGIADEICELRAIQQEEVQAI